MRYLEGQFEQDGYRLPDLMREIAMSDGFRTASPPKAPLAEPEPGATEVSAADTPGSAKEET